MSLLFVSFKIVFWTVLDIGLGYLVYMQAKEYNDK